MPEIITEEEFKLQKDDYYSRILKGVLFIHPTDTIYGIGCNAKDDDAVRKVAEVKKRRPGMPFSVIAPSKKWIYDNCIVSGESFKWIEKLPGPYTFILKLSNKNAVSPLVNMGAETLGIRIPRHWFAKAAQELEMPIVSTSANITGDEFMTCIENLNRNIRD